MGQSTNGFRLRSPVRALACALEGLPVTAFGTDERRPFRVDTRGLSPEKAKALAYDILFFRGVVRPCCGGGYECCGSTIAPAPATPEDLATLRQLIRDIIG